MLGRKELRFALGVGMGAGSPKGRGKPLKDVTLDLWEQDAAVLEVWGGGLNLRTSVAQT